MTLPYGHSRTGKANLTRPPFGVVCRLRRNSHPVSLTVTLGLFGLALLLGLPLAFTHAQVEPGSRLELDRAKPDTNKLDTLRQEAELYGSFAETYRAALAAIEQQNWPRSRQLLDECLQFNPRHEAARLLSAELNTRQGRFEAAVEDYNMVLRMQPRLEEALTSRALLLAGMGRYAPAVQDFQKALKISPDDALLRYNYALTLAEIAEDPAVVDIQVEEKVLLEQLNKALQLDPDLLEAYVRRGIYYALHGEAEKALDDFTLVLEHENNRAEVYTMRGQTYAMLEQYDLAKADYQQSLSLRPTAKTHRLLGHTYYYLGELQKALEAYDQALETEPGDQQLLLARASALALQQNAPEAIDEYTTVLEKDPYNSQALLYRGMMRTLMDDLQGGCQDLRLAGELGEREAERYLMFYCR